MFLKFSALRRPANLKRDERGTLTVFGLVFAILMLGFIGFAVDVMRVEARRAGLQGALDSALLAAANTNQTGDAKAVVLDYMKKAGYADQLVGAPTAQVRGNSREVRATAQQSTTPIFHLYRQDFLFNTTAGAANTAPLLEVSLVLDISGSMGDGFLVPGPPKVCGDDDGPDCVNGAPTQIRSSRIAEMKKGAISFVNTLLGTDDTSNDTSDASFTQKNVSISLIPFTTYVNAGTDLYNAVGLERRTNTNCYRFYSYYYSELPIVRNTGREMRRNRYGYIECPENASERILPLSRDAKLLKDHINALQPRAGTSIYDGVKWGTALLDPSMQSAIRTLTQNDAATNPAARTGGAQWVDPIFAGRPMNYGSKGVHKILVIMSDGNNQPYRTRGDNNMRANCDAADNAGIVIYTIAVDMPAVNWFHPMRYCAHSQNHFYQVLGNKLNETFTHIATETVSLRLTQ